MKREKNYVKSDRTKVIILINRAKIGTKEILRECEETLENIKEVIYAGAYVVTEKLNRKPKKYRNRRTNKKSRWKEKIEKEINELRGEVSILDELISKIKNTEQNEEKI